jgi:hypothetical protein
MVLRKVSRSGRKFGPTWRYLFNLGPTLSYRTARRSLDGEAARIVADLDRDGVAISSVQSLFGPGSLFGDLSEAVETLEAMLADKLAAAAAEADTPDTTRDKTFLLQLLGDYPPLDPESLYVRFALQRPFMRIANAYFGMYTRLRFYNVWHNLTTRAEARESQLWHRDREDHLILKIFVYLSDVDDGAGPFTYAAGTHRKGSLRQEPAYSMEGVVRRSTDAQMAEAVPPERWVTCRGLKGTIVFADTGGYHKGGQAREHDRLLYTCMFTSPASESQDFLERVVRIPPQREPELAFAFAPQRRGPWLSPRSEVRS